MKRLFTFLFFLISLFAKAQSSQNSATVMPDSNTVHVNADPRLAMVVNKPIQKSGFVAKIRGFRVQIYNGNDRKKANQAKLEFMKSFPGVRSYIIYNNPQFRVRVGDFKTRGEAAVLFKKVNEKFNPTMIVPDVINYAEPRKSQSTAKTETTSSSND